MEEKKKKKRFEKEGRRDESLKRRKGGAHHNLSSSSLDGNEYTRPLLLALGAGAVRKSIGCQHAYLAPFKNGRRDERCSAVR